MERPRSFPILAPMPAKPRRPWGCQVRGRQRRKGKEAGKRREPAAEGKWKQEQERTSEKDPEQERESTAVGERRSEQKPEQEPEPAA